MDTFKNICAIIVGVVVLWLAFSFFCYLRYAGCSRTLQPIVVIQPAAQPAVNICATCTQPVQPQVRTGYRNPAPDPDDLLLADVRRQAR